MLSRLSPAARPVTLAALSSTVGAARLNGKMRPVVVRPTESPATAGAGTGIGASVSPPPRAAKLKVIPVLAAADFRLAFIGVTIVGLLSLLPYLSPSRATGHEVIGQPSRS